MNVCIDAVKLKWVLVTLLMNADKFTPHGTITLNYMFRRGNLFVCVKDTGIGIAPENRERIFRHFEKVDTFTQGIGVGLSICKAIVEKADGRIGVRSELGKGSAFWLMIPTKSKDE
jgi:signal transduction histidine kinase